LAAIIYVTENTCAQKEMKNYIGMGYFFGLTKNGTMVGGFGTDANDFKSISVDYVRQTSPDLELCTGLTVIFVGELAILSFPLHLRRHFLKYLFVEGGLNLNYHPNKFTSMEQV
jgi:hypothetical protein